eukprot:CAMPEP_0185585842 /NCGR_PEP_ID=MMETSP0434-20130131/41278_1 /TAXON_ID=626734 ORGANISM="Favella taraikaensis, Strain Fe Narragansett Bay" /NCGR_SAMPLE_ID=MMETSP0434 /ASSEMBLY_ACC=CAM_ASM_000379 /LENGTH=51 /DNA_ID=CAMNT_0028206493 /DNA_START=310 /DNA_END=465 /DNA_ORIENTATION=-
MNARLLKESGTESNVAVQGSKQETQEEAEEAKVAGISHAPAAIQDTEVYAD